VRRHLSEITLVVPDYDTAIAFYVGVLGFELRQNADLGDGKRWVTVAPEGAETALLLARAADDRQRAAIGEQAGGRVAFFLETDDFALEHRAMTDRGVVFEETPRHEPYGLVAVWRDPFGNRWDLLQRSGI
jgi:catechol 2,3-dioxygenase-like lactoylglutathione lyase family enzyme